MYWATFSRIYPEAAADWLAYWRDQGTERPECTFVAMGRDLFWAVASGDRCWSRRSGQVHWEPCDPPEVK